MLAEAEAVTVQKSGTVTVQQATLLLMVGKPELKALERKGAFREVEPGFYWLKDLVQGYIQHIRKSDVPVPVSSAAMAEHLACAPSYVRKLVDAGVIERRADGKFDLDASRLRYIAHLRSERRQSPRSAADTEHAAAKTTLLQIRIEEQRRILVRRDEHEAMLDQVAGLVLTKLSGWPARIAGHDLTVRRKAEAVLRELRVEIAEACTAKADQNGEPPLHEQ